MLSKSVVKYIQSLSHKKSRNEEQLFIAEGPKLINDLLEFTYEQIHHIYATPAWLVKNKRYSGKDFVSEISEADLGRISQLTTAHEVLAIVKQFPVQKSVEVKNRITVVLESLRDPGNLGTIIRTADWFGVEQIICSTDCADLYNPKVVQATMGSIARVKILYTDLGKWLAAHREVRIYATLLEGKDISNVKQLHEAIIIFGNESKGISDEILQRANVKLTIPKKGKAESLNAAVAVGVVLSYCST